MKMPRLREVDAGTTDLIGAGAFLAVAIAGYLLLIHRPLQDGRRLAQARAAHSRVVRDLSAVHADAQRVRRELDAASQELASIGGGLPDGERIDRYLARITVIAAAHGVSVETLAPLPVELREEYRETYIHLVCRGPFDGLHRMLRQIEAELDYADVTHFSIVRGDAESAGCVIDWWLRICSSPAPGATKGVARAG